MEPRVRQEVCATARVAAHMVGTVAGTLYALSGGLVITIMFGVLGYLMAGMMVTACSDAIDAMTQSEQDESIKGKQI